MSGQQRKLALVAPCLLASLTLLAVATEIPNTPEMLADAELTDVFFADFDRGWAVGDRGAIWTTDDAGRNWTRQRSGVSCRLTSVYFHDTQIGWAVGGHWHPYTHQSSGVILRTRDGGRRWQRLPSPSIAAIKRVSFVDVRRGWILCNPSPLCPSGIMHTDDAGLSWSGVPSDAAWDVADWTGQLGACVSHNGRWGQISSGQITGSRIAQSNGPRIRLAKVNQIALDSDRTGWTVGDGGLVLHTHNGGKTWTASDTPISPDVGRHFDFYAVAVRDGHCWIAGSPGTCIFHSPDRGQTWLTYQTDQTLPLLSLTFLDKNHGWAVGSMGTILTTRDGGKSWRRSGKRSRRATILGIFSDPDQIPWELVARLAGNDGYLTAVEILNRRDTEFVSAVANTVGERTHQAVVLAGGSASNPAWQFPVRQQGLTMSARSISAGWNEATGANGAERLKEYIVGKIRQWRPDIVVTVPVQSEAENPLAYLVNQIVLEAVKEAGNPNALSDQRTAAGLEPWKVKKVISETGRTQLASLQLVTTQLAPRLGRSLTQVAAQARAMLVSQPEKVHTMKTFRLLYHDLPKDVARRDFLSGLALSPGSEARRKLSHTPAATVDRLRRLMQRRRNIEQIIAQTQDERSSLSWLGQVQDLIRGQSQDDAASILFQVGHSYRQLGRADLAAEVLQYLVSRFQQHELSAAAAVWLIQYHASSEFARRLGNQLRAESHTIVTRPQARPADSPQLPAGNPARTDRGLVEQTIQKVNHEVPVAADNERQRRAGQALSVGKVLDATWPLLASSPAVRFPLAVACRSSGNPQDVQQQLSTIARRPTRDAWSLCARAESSLQPSRKAGLLKQVYSCEQTSAKPLLDGRLDEDVWRNATRLELKSPLYDDAMWPGTAMLAYDDQFLYFAVTCRTPPGAEYPASSASRPRDSDLSQRDRVDLLIDLDRDYTTFYRLTVDHRGWTGEACGGDPSWNPQWFVAAAPHSPQSWAVEVAIPFSELADAPPADRSTWAFGVQRTVPRVGFQSWTNPAAVQPIASGFGWLSFGGRKR